MVDWFQPHYDALRGMYPELKTDPAAQEYAGFAHRYAVNAGIPIGSEPYWQMIKASLGRGLDQIGDVSKLPKDRLPPLTAAEKQAAHDFLGGDEETYARKKVELLRLKAQGFYSRDRG